MGGAPLDAPRRRIRLSAVRTCRPRLCRCGRAQGRTGRDACRSTSCAHGRGCRPNATERRTEGCRLPWQSPRMEHLWSRADATGGNWSQVRPARKLLERGDWQPLATAGTLRALMVREGVDGSSPSEGLQRRRTSALAESASLNGSPSKVEPRGHSSIAPPTCRRWWRNVYEESLARREGTHQTMSELIEVVTNYLDDALPLDERQRFERHLSCCAGCGTYVHQMRETIRQPGLVPREKSLP